MLDNLWTQISMYWTKVLTSRNRWAVCDTPKDFKQCKYFKGQMAWWHLLHLCAEVTRGRALLLIKIQWFSIETTRVLASENETYFNCDMMSLGYILCSLCCNSSSPHTFIHPLSPYSGRRKGTRYTVKPGGSLKICENWYDLYVCCNFLYARYFLR